VIRTSRQTDRAAVQRFLFEAHRFDEQVGTTRRPTTQMSRTARAEADRRRQRRLHFRKACRIRIEREPAETSETDAGARRGTTSQVARRSIGPTPRSRPIVLIG
jgi:hypothetical protein